jgi:hypothetical protein
VVRGARVTARVSCRGGGTCRGVLAVTARLRGHARTRTVARRRFVIRAPGSRTYHVTLPRAVRRRLLARSVSATTTRAK